MKKRILVTGGAGFIGSHLVNRLVKNYQLAVVDHLFSDKKPPLSSQAKQFPINIQSPDLIKVFTQFRPEIVFHLAANSSVSSSIKDNLSDNIIGTYNLLQTAKMVKVRQVIFTSSAAVYGQAKHLPIKETDPTQPISAYGVSKLTNELHCQLFQSSFKTSILRLANVYGPGQNSSAEGGVVAIFIRQLLHKQTPTIFGTGRQTRDFVFVTDIVQALVSTMAKPFSGIVNLSSNTTTSVKQLLQLISKQLNQPLRHHTQPPRPADILLSQLDNSLAGKKLNWLPQVNLTQGINQTINYFKTQ